MVAMADTVDEERREEGREGGREGGREKVKAHIARARAR
jgi:hypothetical protein